MSKGATLQQEARELRDEICGIIKVLDDHHKKVLVAKIVGGVLTVAASVASVYTVSLQSAGTLVAGTGCMVSESASIADQATQGYHLDKIKKRLESFLEKFMKYYEECFDPSPEDIQNFVKRFLAFFEGAKDACKGCEEILQSLKRRGKSCKPETDDAGKFCEFGTSAFSSKVVQRLKTALTALQTISNVLDLVKLVKALKSGERSESYEKLKRLTDFLDCVAKDEL